MCTGGADSSHPIDATQGGYLCPIGSYCPVRSHCSSVFFFPFLIFRLSGWHCSADTVSRWYVRSRRWSHCTFCLCALCCQQVHSCVVSPPLTNRLFPVSCFLFSSIPRSLCCTLHVAATSRCLVRRRVCRAVRRRIRRPVRPRVRVAVCIAPSNAPRRPASVSPATSSTRRALRCPRQTVCATVSRLCMIAAALGRQAQHKLFLHVVN